MTSQTIQGKLNNGHKLNNEHLDALDLARAHVVILCSRPPAFLLRPMPAVETPREMKKTADRENFLEINITYAQTTATLYKRIEKF